VHSTITSGAALRKIVFVSAVPLCSPDKPDIHCLKPLDLSHYMAHQYLKDTEVELNEVYE